MTRIQTLFAAFFMSLAAVTPVSSAEPLKLLFLGDNGHHQPAARFKELQPVMKERGIELTYTDKLDDLKAETLDKYAGLVIYANQERISREQEKALLDYVANGRGLVALHCASYCFHNSEKYIELVGAQFQRHGTGTFRTIVADEEHPIVRGFGGFESWDETYVHTKHNDKDRTILEWRQERVGREPWTWVRTHGKGRVFYTAWGHDQRTWGNPGFQNLVERGIRWAVGDDPAVVPAFEGPRNATESVPYRPQMTAKRTDVKPFEYVEADVPFYPAGQRWGTVKNEKRKMQLPLPPEESLKHYVTPVGFEMQLFAAEPDIGKSLAMNWDERGRLWLCETLDYPNELKPRGEGRDRIRICEDTNGDGRADKFTVFAEGLSIPSTLTLYRGGVIVQDGTETVYLKDTTGDDKADLRKTLVSGWNMRDTHGGVSNFQYGHDNWYYAMQGYNDSRPVLTDGTAVQSFRQGFFRFKVEGDGEQTAVTEIEFLRSTNNNTWGLGISEEGIIFGSTANGNPSEYMPIPNRYYEAVRGWSASVLPGIAEDNHFEPITENVRQVDHHGGFTAAAGHALYTARNYPKEYWNRTAFVCEPTGHLVATFLITPDGAGFKSRNAFNLVASDDEWAAPIMAEVGPDGNVWILDWYNYIVQHNPTPQGYRTGRGNAYESELRDKRHCRIYRLAYVGQASSLPKKDDPQPATSNEKTTSPTAGKTPAPRSLAGATPQQLVEALKSDNLFWRRHAQRLLVERTDEPQVQELVELLRSPKADDRSSLAALHAMWAIRGTTGWSESNIGTAITAFAIADQLKHPSHAVRRAALLSLPSDESVAELILKSGVLNDREPQVRLAAMLAMAEMPATEEHAKVASKLLSQADLYRDPHLLDAATAMAARSGAYTLTAAAQSSETRLADPLAVERITIIANHTARTGLEDPAALLKELKDAQPPVALAILSGLAAGWPRDKAIEVTPELETLLAELFEKLPVEGKSQLVTLANRWGSTKLADHIAKIAEGLLAEASAEDKNDEQRIAAATQYVTFLASDPAAAGLLDLITPRTSPELARGLVQALGKSQSTEVGQAIADRLGSLTPAVRPTALQVLLSRNEWARPLLDSLEKGNVQLADLSLDQKQALAAHPDRRIAGRARRLLEAGGGLPNADRQKVLEELLPIVTQKGDPDAGKVVLKNQCLKCHTHSGEGAKIGPDLTGMAAHPKNELLVHLIDPSRSVEGNFRVYTVLTADGLVINGLLASESKTAIELIDAEAKKHVVQREDIENLKASTKSLMPEGFEKQVKADDIKNLLEFLTQRGQFVPIPLDKYATITSVRGMFYSEDSQQERLVFDEWGTKTFEGVPFVLVDPEGGKRANAIVLYSRSGPMAEKMPRSVSLTYSGPAKAIHLLSGIAGWAYPYSQDKSTSMIVRLHYENGETEDHKLLNGEHFADYIRRVDVPGSKFAYQLRGQQLRYLSVVPQMAEPLSKIELVKGDDATAPVVMAVTVETAKQ